MGLTFDTFTQRSKTASYVQVLSRGYKSSVRLVLWCMFGVRFAERTSGGPPLYVRTIDSTVRLSDLVYVWPKVQIALLAFLVNQNPN